jgi:hypothetical protein
VLIPPTLCRLVLSDVSFFSGDPDMKWSEGRTTIFGLKSKAYHEREAMVAAAPLSPSPRAASLAGSGEKGGSDSDKAPVHEIV